MGLLRHAFRTFCVTGVAALGVGRAQAQLWLTGAPPGGLGGRLYGLSANGQVAAGWTISSEPSLTGYTWTAATGRRDFGFDPGMPPMTAVQGLSGNGEVAVGRSRTETNAPQRAFLWTETGGHRSLGVVPGTVYSQAWDADYSGAVVVGGCTVDASGNIGPAFRWTEAGGMQALPLAPGEFFSQAHAISGDGTTIVGASRGNGHNAFVWTAAGGTQLLQESVPGVRSSEAFGVNFDGGLVVGRSGPVGGRATIWRAGVPDELPLPAGYWSSSLNSISDDGSVAVGYLNNELGASAAVWTPQYGMEPLAAMLARSGFALPSNLHLFQATAVSADGSVIAGYSSRPNGGGNEYIFSGFVTQIPEPSTVVFVIASIISPSVRRRRP